MPQHRASRPTSLHLGSLRFGGSFHYFTQSHRLFFVIVQFLCAAALITACSGGGFPTVGVNTATPPEAGGGVGEQGVGAQVVASNQPQAEVQFEAIAPGKLAEGQSLYLEILDEVTGLALNASRTKMESQDGQTFTAKMAFPLGSVLKYRYVRDNDPIGIEYTSLQRQVRYRMAYVFGPEKVTDIITAWESQPAQAGLGRIQGTVALKSSNAPVINALITAGGQQTISTSNGSFLLEGLPPGNHNMVVYSLDGSFRPFQQGAVVAVDSTTPAQVAVEQSPMVNVTFLVKAPEGNINGIPVRMVGNVYQLGNTFADLSGGVNVLASRAPFLATQPDGSYSLTLRLPAGLDLRYKYTLGDGFWNAERSANGGMRLRQLIVPNKDITITDTIESWKTSGFEPVSFTVVVPESTPRTDTISIQFNPYGWTEPIPMWPLGNNRWFYVLYNPLNVFQNASYRYCRNEQCGFADAVDTHGPDAEGKIFTPTAAAQDLQDTITSWAWLDAPHDPAVVSAGEIAAKSEFIAGMELLPGYHPSWQPYLGSAFTNIKGVGSNSVILTPTWRLTHQTPPVIEPVSGKDPLWPDLVNMTAQAQQNGLVPLIHPILRYNQDPAAWWQAAPRTDGWWQSWFDRYRTFLLYHADLATQTGAKGLIIGDETISPALPGGTLADGSASGVPADAAERWQRLIADVRIRYSGKLIWFQPYSGEMPSLPPFLKDFDMAYVQLTAPLAGTDAAAQADLEAYLSALLDSDLVKLRDELEAPIFLGLKHPSVRGAFDGCIETGEGCLAINTFDRPGAENPEVELSLKEQADAYSAILSVINQRTWIAGFFSVGYYPPTEARDTSASVHGKPANDVLWFWYPRLLGQTTP